MSFDLRIIFTGLCMFVRDDTPDRGGPPLMHVLLPSTDGLTDVEMHESRLIYDTAHERQGSSDFDRGFRCRTIKGAALDLLGVSSEPVDLTLPKEIVNLDPLVNGPNLPRQLVRDNPPMNPPLRGRLTFDSGRVTDYALGACFGIGTAIHQRMTYQVEWTIRGLGQDHDWLDWAQLSALPAAFGASPTRLYPIHGRINLMVYNLMPTDVQSAVYPLPSIPANKTATHFEAYNRLYPINIEPIDLPVVDVSASTPPAPCQDPTKPPPSAITKGSFFTCMVSSATLAPPGRASPVTDRMPMRAAPKSRAKRAKK